MHHQTTAICIICSLYHPTDIYHMARCVTATIFYFYVLPICNGNTTKTLIKVRIEALREAGISLAQSIIVSCSTFDQHQTILYTLFDLIKSRHAAIRSKSADFIHIMIQNVSLLEVYNIFLFLTMRFYL